MPSIWHFTTFDHLFLLSVLSGRIYRYYVRLCFTKPLFDKIDWVHHQVRRNCAQVKEKRDVDIKNFEVSLEYSTCCLQNKDLSRVCAGVWRENLKIFPIFESLHCIWNKVVSTLFCILQLYSCSGVHKCISIVFQSVIYVLQIVFLVICWNVCSIWPCRNVSRITIPLIPCKSVRILTISLFIFQWANSGRLTLHPTEARKHTILNSTIHTWVAVCICGWMKCKFWPVHYKIGQILRFLCFATWM